MLDWNQIEFSEALSPVIEEFLFFHDYVCIVLVFTITGVIIFIGIIMKIRFIDSGLTRGHLLEYIWTIFPAVLLAIVAVPSLTLLYSLEEMRSCVLTVKAVGHQWYWRYELTDFWSHNSDKVVEFDSYMVQEEDLEAGDFRLLETDNRLSLPLLTDIRVLVRRADVLHSWAVPALGVKTDAIPGRLNQVKFISYRPGVTYGQCSEICGANHRFMPIAIEFVKIEDFLKWVTFFED